MRLYIIVTLCNDCNDSPTNIINVKVCEHGCLFRIYAKTAERI